MKIHEVYDAVAKLGMADNLDDVDAFYYALNRAIVQINSLKPITAMLEISRSTWENLVSNPHFEADEYKGEPLYYESTGPIKSYYFEVRGKGSYYVQTYNGESWDTIAGSDFSYNEFTPIRGLIDDQNAAVTVDARIKLYGDFSFKVRNVAFWDQVYSLDPNDIPAYARFERYDLEQIRDDFLSLDDKPFDDELERMLGEFFVENRNVLLLERGGPADIKIKYNKKPRRFDRTVEVTADNRVLELDAELAELVPLLVAGYIWLEDEPDKAQVYIALYRERSAEIFARRKTISPKRVVSTNGW